MRAGIGRHLEPLLGPTKTAPKERHTLHFGIAIPQVFPLDEVDTALISDILQKAESLGYHSAWVMESVMNATPFLDTLPLLSYAAACSTRLKLGTSVMVSTLAAPFALAKALASVDRLSGGRLIWGVGLGHSTEAYPVFGIPREGRIRRFEDGIRLVKRLWTEDSVTYHGRFWQLDEVALSMKPLQKPHPPIWFGSFSPPGHRRAAKMADGWMGAGSTPTETFKEHVRLVRQYLEEEGRDPATFPLSKRVFIGVDKDRKSASKKVAAQLGRIYATGAPHPLGTARTQGMEAAVCGSVQECIEGLAEIAANDLELIMLQPMYEPLEQVERLAKDVLPNL